MRKVRPGASVVAALLLGSFAFTPAGAGERFDGIVQFGTGPGTERVWDVARDAAGSSYLVGSTWGAFPGFTNEPEADGFVTKVSSTGELLWVDQFGGRDNGDNVAAAVALDGHGGVYVVGSTHRSLHATAEGYTDPFVRKYSEDGSLLWGDQFHGAQAPTTENWAEYATDVVVADGVVWVTGTVDGHGFLRRYSTAGALIEHQDEAGGGELTDVVVNGSDVYVAGVQHVLLDPWSERQAFVRRITAAGTTQVDLEGSSWPTALASDGDAVVVARYLDDGTGAVLTLSDRALTEVWSTTVPDPVEGLAVDDAGDVFGTGLADWESGVVRKHRGADGSIVWEARIGTAGMDVRAVDVVDGQVLFAGPSASELTPGGVGAFVATWPTVRSVPLTRLAGADRVQTAIAVSQAGFGEGTAGGAVLVSGRSFADALVAGPLAAMNDGPVLLVGDRLGSRLAAELQRVLPPGTTVTIVGGTGAVSTAVEDAARGLGFDVTRVSGATRFETAVEVARSLGSPAAMIADGLGFADALAASPAAVVTGRAVVLSAGSSLPAVSRDYLVQAGSGHVAVGGPAAHAAPGAETVVGVDRYDTAAQVLARFFGRPHVVGVASGADFADALAMVPMLARQGAPLLLTEPDQLAPATEAHIHLGLLEVYLAGGTSAVGTGVEQRLQMLLTER